MTVFIPKKVNFLAHGTTVPNPLEQNQDTHHSIGTRSRKVDGAAKATGETLYADDISLPGMLHCKIKRSIRPHARIVSINTKPAEDMEGVHAVMVGDELPTKYGIIPWTQDETPLAVGRVRHVGEGVAAVAAIDEETAIRAIRAIEVTYEDLPPILSCEEAKVTGDTPETKVNDKAKRGNITKRVDLAFGDTDDAIKNSDVVVDGQFYFCGTTHAAIEPHCAIGHMDARGLLTVISATQVPHYLHRDLAWVLKIPANRIRVIQPAVGGAFGGKSEPFDLEFVVAYLSMKCGRPVKCLYEREEVFYAHRGRHPMEMAMKLGASTDGTLKGLRSEIDIDGGAYASFGLITAYYAGQLLTGPVGYETYHFTATRYYTNKPACGPKRGHGSVQPRFAFEILLDMMAEKLNMDPFELRQKNFVGHFNETVNGQQMGTLGLEKVLQSVRTASQWDQHQKTKQRGRGLGVATSMYISGTNYPIYPNQMPQSGVQVQLDRSGRATIFSGASDIGQGSDSVLATIVCEELGTELGDVQVVSSDTDLTPVDLGAYSSRVTLMMGHAAQEACRSLRKQIQEAVFNFWQDDEVAQTVLTEGFVPKDVLLAGAKAFYRYDTQLQMPLAKAFQLAEAENGTLGATGGYRTQMRGGDYRGGTIGSSPAYSCTAHLADVSVDEETGQITVHKIWCAHDCGKALNPVLVEGQIEGSTYMGAAEVALEEMHYGPNDVRHGMLVGPSLLDYRIPTTLDTPAIEALIVEEPDPNGPYGAKEAGEGPLHSSIPAVANAIYDAVGIRLTRLPFSPQKVLAALREQRQAAAGANGQTQPHSAPPPSTNTTVEAETTS
ncbi:MAG: aldehyde oxidase [Myxococcales bacterium]|nr:aldehyde oxidase [Myxococcales bacterium]